jgi:hypothetical protein
LPGFDAQFHCFIPKWNSCSGGCHFVGHENALLALEVESLVLMRFVVMYFCNMCYIIDIVAFIHCKLWITDDDVKGISQIHFKTYKKIVFDVL